MWHYTEVPLRDKAQQNNPTAGDVTLATSFSCVTSYVQQWHRLFLPSSCFGQNNREILHLVQPSTLLLYDPPGKRKEGKRHVRMKINLILLSREMLQEMSS